MRCCSLIAVSALVVVPACLLDDEGHVPIHAWFADLARVLHAADDFQRVLNTSGNCRIVGFAINSQLVYQAYAPGRVSELIYGGGRTLHLRARLCSR
jgi:hypothetical protein